MRTLLDHNVPAYLLPFFANASTTAREGWQALSNGELLTVAQAAGFQLLVTLDRGFRSQQNLAGRSISIAIIVTHNQSRATTIAAAEALIAAIPSIQPGTVTVFRSP